MNLFFINTRSIIRYGSGMADESSGGQNAYLLTVPLFHATGCHAVMITNTAAGGKLVLMHHFEPTRALTLIQREKVTTFGGVPTMVMQVLDSTHFADYDVTSVRSVSYGGAPAPKELVKRIQQHFPIGQPGNGYGLTETSAVTSMNTGQDYIQKPDSVGPPVPVTDVAVVPEDFDGEEPTETLPKGNDVVGELWVKGPQVVRGYWGRPKETSLVFTKGWLHTGDVAKIDQDGFIIIVDRAKDMVIRGGENVYCVEVEDALFSIPGVLDCAVIGVPHDVLGEEVGCVLVLRPGAHVDLEVIRHALGQTLAKFKMPTHVFVSPTPLPRNPQGKVLKNVLRQEFVQEKGPVG
jgi:long-chain acyl-CoA synthetase